MHCYVALGNIHILVFLSRVVSIHSSVSYWGPVKKARPIKVVKICLCLILHHYTIATYSKCYHNVIIRANKYYGLPMCIFNM